MDPGVLCFRLGMSLQRLSRLWQRLFSPAAARPPYSHVVQLGDPALRAAALPVKPEEIQSPEIQEVNANQAHFCVVSQTDI